MSQAMSCCEKEIDCLKEKINNLSIKSEELKSEYKKILIENLQIDLKIKNLKRELEKKKIWVFKEHLSESCIS